mgnify:CR=1 FL=1
MKEITLPVQVSIKNKYQAINILIQIIEEFGISVVRNNDIYKIVSVDVLNNSEEIKIRVK